MRIILLHLLLTNFAMLAYGQDLSSEDYCIAGLCPFDSVSKGGFLLGKPLSTHWERGEDDSTQYLQFNGVELEANAGGRIVHFAVSSPQFRTYRNAAVGDSVTSVKAAYGVPNHTRDNTLIYDSQSMYLSFETSSGIVTKISIGFYRAQD